MAGSNFLMMNLRTERIKKGLTQSELAKRSRVQPNLICKYEQGKLMPRRNTLEKIAKELDCSVEWLLRNCTDTKTPEIELEELRVAAMPLVVFLRKKGHPNMTAVITGREIHLTENVMGMPMDYDD